MAVWRINAPPRGHACDGGGLLKGHGASEDQKRLSVAIMTLSKIVLPFTCHRSKPMKPKKPDQIDFDDFRIFFGKIMEREYNASNDSKSAAFRDFVVAGSYNGFKGELKNRTRRTDNRWTKNSQLPKN